MDYEQFICAMSECTKAQLSGDETVEIQRILKNNGVAMVGLAIRKEGQRIAPLIYLEGFYEQFLAGESVENLSHILLNQREEAPELTNWDYGKIFDFREIKDRILFKLINTEKNEELLKEVPHIPMLDFSIVFYLMLPTFEEEKGSILVKNEHCRLWGTDQAELYECAKENAPKHCPHVFCSLAKFLAIQFLEEVEEEDIFVLTNEQGVNGAAVVLYPNILQWVFGKLEGSYYLLPASVHEFLVVPSKRGITAEELRTIVREVNQTQISREEFLSDDVYLFDGDNITKM